MNIALFSKDLKTAELNQLDFILELIEAGHNPVVYVLNDSSESALLKKINVKVINVDFISEDLCALRSLTPVNKLADLFEENEIDILLSSSIVPCVYGALAGKRAKLKKIFSQFTDIGRLFQTNKSSRKAYIKFLCKLAAKNSDKVIFHNMDNMMFFVGKKMVKSENTLLVGGYGINIEEYSKSEYKNSRVFFMASPLAVDKGVMEFIQAAGIVKQLNKDCTFKLLVKPDMSDYGIDIEKIRPYAEKGYIEIVEDYDASLEPLMEECACFVMPSYHEEMPFELLLAMAKGRPVIASDVPGCRDAVLDGINGYIVPPQNVEVLVQRILGFLDDEETATQMAQGSYDICVQKYDVYDVCKRLMDVIFADDGEEE